MNDVLIIQNSKNENAGELGNLLEEDGFRLDTIYAKLEKLPQKNYCLAIILGAPQSANDDLQYLKDQLTLVKKFVKKNIPVLGICLGSQLIAKSLGADVFRGSIKEIGFYNDVVHEANTRLFDGIKNPFTVFHWHSETFDLPKKAVRLAHSTNYKNQAFQYGSAVGLQFHLEVNEDMLSLWLKKIKEKLNEMPGIDLNKIEDDMTLKLPAVNNNLKIFYKNFKSIFNL